MNQHQRALRNVDPSTPATDEQAIVVLLYAALHQPDLAIDAATLIARSPHWIGGPEIAVIDADLYRALYDLSADHTGTIRETAIAIVTKDGLQ